MDITKIIFRDAVNQSDVDSVRNIVTSSGYFNNEEINVAVELVTERIEKGEASGYEFLLAESEQHEMMGYSCYGKIPGTKSSYALYWIAVDQKFRNHGLGRMLLQKTETEIFGQGGTGIFVETSSKEQYLSTRTFYSHSGYLMKARLKDYYDKGDDLVFFVKQVF